MFEVGEYIVHPLHGVGRIVEKKEVQVMNHNSCYYVVKPLVEKLSKVMVPVDKVEELNIRRVLAPQQVEIILSKIKEFEPDPEEDKETNWNVAYKKHVEIIKRGSVEQVGKLCKKLIAKNKIKPLGTKEEELLSIGKKILISEMMVSFGIDKTAAEERFSLIMEEAQPLNPYC